MLTYLQYLQLSLHLFVILYQFGLENKFMRDCTEKTQAEFANDLNKKGGWTAKLEGGETNIH